MNLYPKAYFSKVEEITIQFLKEKKLKALILDIDNTLIDYNENLSEEKVNWVKELRGQGIKFYILSNSNNKKKVENVSKKLNIPYINFAKKPLKMGFLKTKKELKEEADKIGVVGDQIFTDIVGGNRCNMFTILVDPIEEKDFFYTAWKRPLENKIKSKIQKTKHI